MSEVSNNQIYELICTIKGDVGAIKQSQDSHTQWMVSHVADDKLMAADIQSLKLAHAKQRGFMTALAGVGGLISGAIGYAVEYFHR